LLDHAQRLGWDAEVTQVRPEGTYQLARKPIGHPLVSVIIPTAFVRKPVFGINQLLVENCIKKMEEFSTYPNVEYIVVTNVKATQRDRQKVFDAAPGKVSIVSKIAPFNFSRQLNYASTFAKGDLFLLLNDDTQIITPTSVEAMVSYFNESDVGVVGCLLLTEEEFVQHAGVVFNNGSAGHFLFGFDEYVLNFSASILCSRESSAVTFGVAMVSRELFREVGGLSELLPNSYNDVDFCAKTWTHGYRVVWTPLAKFYHFESASRDFEVKDYDREQLNRRWRSFLQQDPFTNKHLKLINYALVGVE
jgi:hypothetical protein